MHVLLTGADGFIGQALVRALLQAGHRVTGCVRRPDRFKVLFPGLPVVPADFARDHRPADWLPRLQGIDAVINAVGIFQERGAQTFAAIHTDAPCALFAACAQAGVQRVIQISALGADEAARSGYHRSKKAADDCLARLPLDWVIVQPSLVYGPGGTSAALFTALASLPLIPLPAGGGQRVQPVHLDDLTALLVRLLGSEAPSRTRLAAVGPRAVTLREWLAQLRGQLGLGTARVVAIPLPLVRAAAWLGEHARGSLLTREALEMLLRGNTADPAPMRALLGRAARATVDFIERDTARIQRQAAQLGWLLPLLRLSIAFTWLAAGVVSLGIYPREASYALLAQAGITGGLAPVFLFGAALLDLALGLATLLLAHRRWLWRFQLGLILVYTAIITWFLPEFWLHPFGPVVKNVPLLAALVLLLKLEE